MPLTCTPDAIAEAAKCFQNPCIDENERMALAVLFRAYQLVTAGGTDYTADFDALIADSKGFDVIGHSAVSAEQLALLQDATTGAPDTLDELLTAVACLRCHSLEALRRALLLLSCAITAEG